MLSVLSKKFNTNKIIYLKDRISCHFHVNLKSTIIEFKRKPALNLLNCLHIYVKDANQGHIPQKIILTIQSYTNILS